MMGERRRFALIAVIAALLTGAVAAVGPVRAQGPPAAAGVVKLGLILDMTGPYASNTGIGSATAARMAVADFGGRVLGRPIEVLIADSQNSSDRAAAVARDWFGKDNVTALMDVTGSSEALIVQRIAQTRDKIVMLESADAERLSNEACTPTSVHYGIDTYAIANTLGAKVVEAGDKTWFFITVDYSFGFDLEHNTAAVVEAHGGQVLGNALYPLGSGDFESYLARARQSGAKVIGLAAAGGDLDNIIREAARLGMIPGRQVLAGLVLRITGVHALGLATAQGMLMSVPFYWDMNDETRAWSKRFYGEIGAMPTAAQAAVYSATTHYLQAVARAGTLDAATVMKTMLAMPVHDFYAPDGRIRIDGVLVHQMHLFRIKTPGESRYPWDYLKLLATVPGTSAFAPLTQSKCPIVRQYLSGAE
ncbi:MAG TPA: ABC transporter substrate-binding protein [Stellaceae bacterium]|nr:ABC transporter substrate-binding protein [Stellaceae bacterium]